MYGQPAINFTHEGGIGSISEHLRQLLAQDVENHLDRKLYDNNLSHSNGSTILKTKFETLLETAEETERQERRKESPAQPYEPMLNLFAAYADKGGNGGAGGGKPTITGPDTIGIPQKEKERTGNVQSVLAREHVR